jgi:hypothetical protein
MQINESTIEPEVDGPAASDPTPPEGQVELFRLSDDPEDIFYIPSKIGPNVSIKYLRDVKKHGETYALAALMERVLGEEAMDALSEYEDLTEEEMDRIGKIIEKYVMGAGPLAGNRAARRSGGSRR